MASIARRWLTLDSLALLAVSHASAAAFTNGSFDSPVTTLTFLSDTGGTLPQTFDTSPGTTCNVNYLVTSMQGGATPPAQLATGEALNGTNLLNAVSNMIAGASGNWALNGVTVTAVSAVPEPATFLTILLPLAPFRLGNGAKEVKAGKKKQECSRRLVVPKRILPVKGHSLEGTESITAWLRDWAQGDAAAMERLIPLVYGELRQLAESSLRNERFPPTNPTSLVHDLFLKLTREKKIQWESREQFWGVSAHIMRQLLVTRARQRGSLKRGGGFALVPLGDGPDPMSPEDGADQIELILLDRALEKLNVLDPALVRLVELRYFVGLSLQETAEATGVSLATTKRRWTFARRWLFTELSGSEESP